MLDASVLVLNRSYIPVHITTIKHALCLLYRNIAKVVDHEYSLYDFKSWSELSVEKNEDHIGLLKKSIRVPKVILLQYFDRVPNRPVRFSRLNVYLRDKNICQYCHKRFSKSELNLDHVIPLSLGGETSWENIVCSCIACNLKKGGRSPQKAGMTLLKKPLKPNWSIFYRLASQGMPCEDWRPFLSMVDFSYWNSELEHED